MKKRLGLLLAGFIIIYYLVHAADDLPELVHGNHGLQWLPSSRSYLLHSLREMAIAFLYPLSVYLVLHRFYPQQKFITALVTAVATLLLLYTLHYQLIKWITEQPFRLRTFFSENLFFICVYLLYGIVFYFIRYAQYRELQQQELLLQNRQSELSFLRSQVNPHFLFNSLNNIYALVYEQSEHALPAIAGLSEMLRYMLYDTNEKVPLAKEVAYIEQYIALQRLRFDHPVHAALKQYGDISGREISPLLLVPFVENAFKHGDFSEGGSGVDMQLTIKQNELCFYASNQKGRGLKDSGGGVGLNNVRRRLTLLYPGKHQLEINDTTDLFTVNLTLTHES